MKVFSCTEITYLCENCGKPCKPSEDYPTAKRISTLSGCFCSMECVRHYAEVHRETIMKTIYGDD